ncbi:MAG: 16S rRNA (guanine(966)-N(2))-methyltransferase RsmD [Phycisphaerales bacterium]
MSQRVTIVGGEHRSRVLETPRGMDLTRPMTGRVKESIFNILRGWCEGAAVLDLFSGVGTMGLEAISRGARHATLVERDHEVFDCARRNIEMLGVGDRAVQLQSDALSHALFARLPERYDLVFMDPPYALAEQASGKRRILEQCARLRSAMQDRGWLVLRLPNLLEPQEEKLAGFDGPEVRSFGDMHVYLYTPAGGAPPASPAPGAADGSEP